MLLPLADELSKVFSRILDKHQKAWEMDTPEKITVTYILNKSGKPVKVLIHVNSDYDLKELAGVSL